MWIKEYSNEQYAGVHQQDVRFQPGVNVILGDNEAGKSTMIAGIYDTLTKSHKIDGRREKDFIAQRFPSGGANSIDGTVCLEADGRQLVVKKEWDKSGADNRAVLMVDGAKITGAAAEAKLKELLQFSGAIYDNIVFGRQNNEEEILRWLYSFLDDSGKKTDDAVAEARERVSGAISAAGGISEDKLLERLNGIIDALSGKWDMEADRPLNGRGLSNPWKNGAGEIVKAYYAFEEKRTARDDAQRALEAFSKNEQALEEKKLRREALRQEQKALAGKKADAVKGDSLKRDLSRLTQEDQELEQAAQAWPRRLEEQRLLEQLAGELAEKQRREAKTRAEAGLAQAQQLTDEIRRLTAATEGLEDIPQQVKLCRRLAADISASRGTLSSGKLHAQVKLLSGHTGTMQSASGEAVSLAQCAEADVDGYVKITIPGVAEVMVAPQNIDVAGLQARIQEGERQISEILNRYQAQDVSALEARSEQYLEDQRSCDSRKKELSLLPVDEYERDAREIQTDPALPVRENLEEAVAAQLRGSGFHSLDGRLGAVQQALEGYQEKYGSPEALRQRQASLSDSRGEIRRQLELLPTDVPSAQELEQQDRRYESQIQLLNQEIETLSKALGSCDDIDLEALEQEMEECRRVWEQKKALCRSYCTIRQDFLELQDTGGGKYDAFFEHFNRNLAAITGGQLEVSDDQLFTSRGNPGLRSDLLSRGTRQTVLLAFRLSLLEYYFPQEGGVVVLDDVLLDMDPSRRENAVRLIQAFAQRHQVIFTTCDPAIAQLLGGHLIHI